MSKIFISYRRDDSADITGRIYDRLVAEFGERNVFMDVTSIPYGTHYPLYIPKQIDKCEVFLAVIGRNWMQSVASTGGTRLDDLKDPVRIEVEAALNRPILVIPVLVSGASFPSPDRLPATIKDLTYRHGSEVRTGADFHRDMDRLIEVLKKQVQGSVDEWTKPSETGEAVAEDVKEGAFPVLNEKLATALTALDERHLEGPMKAKSPICRKPTDFRSHQPRQESPLEMVKVPKGPFLYGEQKTREVIEYDYWIDQYPVTNKKYAAFVSAGSYENRQYWSPEVWRWKTEKGITCPAYWDDVKRNKADHPVVGVSCYEAEAYAKWAGKRLPTEREWEKAARGEDGREYPWGDKFDRRVCNSNESPWRLFWGTETTPVAQYSKGVSPYGCYDMAGNVYEWCADLYDKGAGWRVIRGGSWNYGPGPLRASARGRDYADLRGYLIGFRLVQNIDK